MKRAAFLICAGIDVSRWKVLGHRQQLPFVPAGGDRYTLRDAFLMRAMLMAMDGPAGAVGPSDAVRLITHAAGKAAEAYGPEPVDLVGHGAAVWLGAVEFAGVDRHGEVERWVGWYAGPLEGLGAFIAAQLADPMSEALRGAHPVRVLALVNATAAAAEVIAKADEQGGCL